LIPSGSAAGAVHCRRRSSPTIFTTENENTSFTHTECLYTPVLFLPAPPLVLCIAGGDHLQPFLLLKMKIPVLLTRNVYIHQFYSFQLHRWCCALQEAIISNATFVFIRIHAQQSTSDFRWFRL